MPAPITLPKVASYVRNVGKSIGLASIDYLKEAAPTTAEFLETNEDIFKEIVSSVSDYRSAIKKANTAFKKSKVYEALDVGKKALFEDLRTGNWYNKEREEAIGMRAMDLDMDDEGFDDSMFSFDDTDSSDAARQSRAFDSSISASTKVQATTTAKTGELVSGTIKASTSVLFAQNERLMASMTSGMGTLHAAVSGVQDYLQGPMLTALQNTKIFQEKSMEHYAKVEAQLDEFLQMQRNLYEAASTETKNSLGMDDVIDFDGIPDLSAYGQVIKKNFKNLLGPEAEMLLGNAFGKNSNMLLTLVSSPLKAIPELLVKTIVPLTVKRTMEQFDKSISGVFTTLISRLNFMASEDFGGNGIFSTIGKILGINVQAKNAPEVGKFKKGPIPFDGITKQAIVEVIPAHLRRIEAALTGASERLYDMSNGRWTTVNEAKERYDERKKSVSRSSFSDVAEPINKYIEELRKENTEATQEMADRFVDALKTITDKVYEDKGRFLGYKRHNDPDFGDQSAWDYYNVDKDIYMTMMKLANKSDIMNLANSTFREISSWNSFIKNIEQDPTNIYNQLFNNAYQFDRTKTPNGVPYSNFLTAAVDENKKNIFYYLRGIYGILLANNRNGNRRRSTTEGGKKEAITPEEALREALNSDTIVNSTTDTSTGPVYNTEGRSPEEVLTSMLFALKQDEDGNPIESEERVFKKFTKGSSFSEKWKIAQENINLVLTKPTEALTKIINRADTRVFELLFGKEETAEMERKYGNKPGGVIEYMVIRLEESFNKLDEWLQDNVFNKIRDWLKDTGITDKFNQAKEWVKEKIHWDDIREAAKNKFSWAKGQVTGAFRAVGRDVYNSSPVQQTMYTGTLAANQRRRTRSFTGNNFSDILGSNRGAIGGNNGNISDDVWEEFKNKIAEYRASGMTYNQAEEAARRDLGFAASGKFITKRGLAVVSPGEIIIPATFSKAGQSRQLSKEKSYAKRFGFKNVGYYATGTDSIDGQAKGVPVDQVEEEKHKVADTIRQVAREVNMSGDYADLAVNSLIGGGVSLITGMVGGPLLGAALGAGISIIKQSETAKRFLFGKEGEDGEREGGLFSAKFQKNFKKYFPDMKNYGIVGSIAGLFTPFGLVGGLMAGGAIGFLKNNESFQNFLFGPADENGERDGGIISKAFREKVTKAAPTMAVGAVGGLLFGPFGILGNAVLGSAVGYITTTQKFHDIIFGYDDENGKHKDGLIDGLKKGLVDPLIRWGTDLTIEFKEFFNEKILKPLGDFVDPAIQMIKNMITSIGDRINDSFQKKVVTPIGDFVQHTILEPFGKVIGKVIRLPINLAKGVVSMPFQALGFVGRNIRGSQIAKGTATDMTAAERVQWREQHQGRRTLNNILGRDKFGAADKLLATQFEGDKGLDELKEMRDNMKIYLETRKDMGSRVAKLEQDLFNEISRILNENTMEVDGRTISVYTYLGYAKYVKPIKKLISAGDLEGVQRELTTGKWRDVPPEVIAEILTKVRELGGPIQQAILRQKNAAEYNARFESKMAKITKGHIKSRNDIRRFMRNVDKEIQTRTDLSEEEKDRKHREEVAENQTDRMQEFLDKQKNELLEALNAITKAIYTVNGREEEYKKEQEEKRKKQAADAEQSAEGEGSGLDYDFMGEDINPDEVLPRSAVRHAARTAVEEISNGKRGIGSAIRRFRRNFGYKASNLFNNIKAEAIEGFMSGREQEALRYENKKKNREDSIVDEAAERAQETIDNASIVDRVVPQEEDENKVSSVGGILTGNKSDIIREVDNGYHIVNVNGKVGVADSDNKLLSTNSASDVEQEQDKEDAFKEKQAEASEKMSNGIVSMATGLLGKGWEFGKRTVGGLIDSINNILDSNPITSLIKSIIKGVLAVSVIGHIAGFFTEVLKPALTPIWEKITESLGELGSGALNWLNENLPGVGSTVTAIKDEVVDFFSNPVAKIGSWIVDGLKKFWDYVAEPLGTLIWNAIHSTTLDDFNTKTRTTVSKESQAVNENGELLYVDSEGNTTTEEYDANGVQNEKKTSSINVSTETKNTGLSVGGALNWITHGFKSLSQVLSATYDGTKYTLEKYTNGLIVIRNESTGDFVKFTIGDNKIKVGCKTDEDGRPSVGSIIGSTVGMAVAGTATITKISGNQYTETIPATGVKLVRNAISSVANIQVAN